MGNRYYYFANKYRQLRYNDNRLIEEGVTHTVEPPLNLCRWGLHASRRAIDALTYDPGPTICIVELGGEIIHGDDKSCATERTYLKVFNGASLLEEISRRCALDVIDLWEAPDVVREYLETGDERLRKDAKEGAAKAYQPISLEAPQEAAISAARWAILKGHYPTCVLRASCDAVWEHAWNSKWGDRHHRNYCNDHANIALRDFRKKQNTLLEQMIAKKIKGTRND